MEHPMTKPRKIRAVGKSLGVTIPKAMLERYRMSVGDTVNLIETERGILLTSHEPEFLRAMEVYAEGAKRYRNALRELAK